MAKLLIADDERESADAVGMLLKSQGHEVVVAYSGEAVLASAVEFRPDVLIIDYLLSDEVDGCGIAGQLCQADPRLEVIVMTGLPEREFRARASGDNFTFIAKPLDIDALFALVRARAERRGSHR